MTSIILILIGIQVANLLMTFFVLLYLKEIHEKKLQEIPLLPIEEKKGGFTEERKKKISQSQKIRWAKKKGATNLIAPVAWPENSHQAVN